jgi:hypothetical protein
MTVIRVSNDVFIKCATPDCHNSVLWWAGDPRPRPWALCSACLGTETPGEARARAAAAQYRKRMRRP